jgi:hypothetical protein
MRWAVYFAVLQGQRRGPQVRKVLSSRVVLGGWLAGVALVTVSCAKPMVLRGTGYTVRLPAAASPSAQAIRLAVERVQRFFGENILPVPQLAFFVLDAGESHADVKGVSWKGGSLILGAPWGWFRAAYDHETCHLLSLAAGYARVPMPVPHPSTPSQRKPDGRPRIGGRLVPSWWMEGVACLCEADRGDLPRLRYLRSHERLALAALLQMPNPHVVNPGEHHASLVFYSSSYALARYLMERHPGMLGALFVGYLEGRSFEDVLEKRGLPRDLSAFEREWTRWLEERLRTL